MLRLRQVAVFLLVPSLIWVLSSACGVGGGESSSDPARQAAGSTDTPQATAEPALEGQEPGEVAAATTVFAAAQIIDLRGLPLPTEIKAMRRSEVGHMSVELWDDLASVVGLYEPAFIEDGWQNDTEHEFTDENAARRFFSKDGFVVSMSVRSLGESTLVTFINHGNVDLRALPQAVDAEPLYQFPDRLLYVTPSSVDEVAAFTRQELAAQGWHQNTMPDTSTADLAGSLGLLFVQNGLALATSIRAAPDQGDKTVVAYGITVLPLDLPVYDEAVGVEFGQNPPYLGYRSGTGLDTLAGFYRTQMSRLGWEEVPESASIRSEQVALLFVGQKLYANDRAERTVMLELALVDGETEVTLRQVEAGEVLP
jgi:hypothetical protein